MANDARPRLHFLDGLRGLACFYVLLFHAGTQKVEEPGTYSAALRPLMSFLEQGKHSVVFFIVLSGFSLMLPVARSGTGALNGGFGGYIYRRARRILPPYYVALLVSILVIVAYNQLASRGGERISDAALSVGSIVSHVLLVHNLNFEWVFRINGPMWSVATEWHIYFLFALMLLPLRRRLGMLATVAIAWVVFTVPVLLVDSAHNLYWASPWFVGSFAIGMYGADLAFTPDAKMAEGFVRVPWRAFAVLTLVWVSVVAYLAPNWHYAFVDFGISVFAFAWIGLSVVQSRASGQKRSKLLSFLESRALVYLGGFSYSLYLVQHPLFRLSEKIFNKLHVGHDANVLLHLLVVTPVIIAIAWLFAELFERPFTTGGVLWPALQRRFRPARPVV